MATDPNNPRIAALMVTPSAAVDTLASSTGRTVAADKEVHRQSELPPAFLRPPGGADCVITHDGDAFR